MTGATVRLSGVTRRFGPVEAVAGVDLELPAGKLTALVGPSGCGKTTTLRLVAGFERPDSGTVVIGSSTVAGNGRFVPPERRRVGMVFQQLALFPHLTVAGNVGYGLTRRDRTGRVRELLELVGLSGYDRRYPDELSGGQAQRVALARALAPRPQVLLLDEPFSSLDVSLRAELRAEVRDVLRAYGVTALLVTHDQDEALSMGDVVAVMDAGRVVQAGPPEDVYLRPATSVVAAIVGGANSLLGEVVDGQVRCAVAQSVMGPLVADGLVGPVVVLLRFEDVDVVADPTGDAIVEDASYYGHDQLLVVALASGERLRARLQTRHKFDRGVRVRVSVRPGAVRVLPAPSRP